MRRGIRRLLVRRRQAAPPAQQQRLVPLPPPPFLVRGEPDDAQPPRLETRPSVVAQTPLQPLHISVLQDLLRQRVIAATAVKRPAKRIRMQGGELLRYIVRIHS